MLHSLNRVNHSLAREENVRTMTCTLTTRTWAIIGGMTGVVLMALVGGTLFFTHSPVRSEDALRPQFLEQYIRAQLKLAQIELKQVQQTNARIPNVFPKAFEDRLRDHVMIKEEQLKVIQNEGRDNFVKIHKLFADTQLKMAVLELQRAQLANNASPEAVPEIEVQRLESAVEVLRLHAALADSPLDQQSSMTFLMWQLDELSEDVLNLEMKVSMLSMGWRKLGP